MDVNGQKFWMASALADWESPLPRQAAHGTNGLRLASVRESGDFGGSRGLAQMLLELVPPLIDTYGHIGFLAPVETRIALMVRRPGERIRDAREVFQMDPGVTSIACGIDGLLYVASPKGVLVRDLHPQEEERFAPELLEAAILDDGFEPFRLAADPAGGCWVLARDGAIARIEGMPLPALATQRLSRESIRPLVENVKPLSMRLWSDTWRTRGGAARIVAIAYSTSGGLALLRWNPEGSPAELIFPIRTVDEPGTIQALQGMESPFSLAWMHGNHLAMMYPGATEAAVYENQRGFTGGYFPLGDGTAALEQPFAATLESEAVYLLGDRLKRVQQVSLPVLARSATVRLREPFDPFDPRTVWHRLYLEACIPQDCSIRVWALASNEKEVPPETVCHEHLFGAGMGAASGPPRGVWTSEVSEIPFHQGMLNGDRIPGHSGLFLVLLQRTGLQTSALTGRYLHLRVELSGPGHASPEMAVLRVYGSRFNYAERYFPEFYRETEFGPDADIQSPRTTAPDFLSRFLSLFESYLTPLEGRVANAYLVTRPATVPEESLSWLASWVGVTFDPALPQDRQREWLRESARLHQWRGTLPGFSLALDIATGGGVRGGEIVIVEQYRLRRVLATILGVDLALYDDPLLPGTHASGNSIVGDTLLIGEESQREVLALFDASLQVTAGEQDAIERLSDRLAHRVTILIHNETNPVELGLLRRVAEREKPAHVQLTISRTSTPFLVGIGALVGVDTYLATKPKPGPVRADRSAVGVWDVIGQRPGLDFRISGE